MGKAIALIGLTWLFTILAYVIIAFTYPTMTGITTDTVTTISASSNMTNYPGTVAFINGWPLILWFVPGGIAIVVTVVELRKIKSQGV